MKGRIAVKEKMAGILCLSTKINHFFSVYSFLFILYSPRNTVLNLEVSYDELH